MRRAGGADMCGTFEAGPVHGDVSLCYALERQAFSRTRSSCGSLAFRLSEIHAHPSHRSSGKGAIRAPFVASSAAPHD
jgi:hypothetical protein